MICLFLCTVFLCLCLQPCLTGLHERFELQVVSSDLNTFSQFARDVLINLPNVKDLHTSFSLGEVKSAGALPLGHLSPKSMGSAKTGRT